MSRGVIDGVGIGSERAVDGRSLTVRASATTVPVLAALAAVVAWTGFRALHNAPVDLPAPVVGAAPWLGAAAGLLPGVAAVALGLSSSRPTVRVGLVFAGVFGALGTVVPAVAVPATFALVAGGAFALVAGVGADRGWLGALRRAVPVVLLGGVALSLGAATGLLAPGARSAGTVLTLAGLAGSPAFVRPGPGGWALGTLAAAGVLWAGSTLPFVAGAVTLVAFGLVGTPLPLFAAGVGGCVAAVVGALRREASGSIGRFRGAGAALVLLGGAPGTVGAATAVVLGAALLAGVSTTRGDRR